MTKILSLSLFFTAILSTALFSQNIYVDNLQTPTSLVQNVLVGQGLSVSNVTFTGNAAQIGYFEGNGSNIGLDSGVVMSSGSVLTIVPPGNPSTSYGGPGDPDVLATAQSVTSNPSAGSISSTHDAAVLEFDFVPDGDLVSFRFVFASEEYTTWINTVYNDAFGFYLTGPNPAGGNYTADNLALVPGTNEPITISTIHPGLNAAYYIGTPSGHSFNGFSIPIDIQFYAVCGQSYHFKFAVADCQDGILDTGVFLEGGSFNALPVELTFETTAGDTLAFEGCNEVIDMFVTRPSCQSVDTLVVDLDYSGTASSGLDYINPGSSVTFLPGVDSMVLQIIPIADLLNEGIEEIVITATTTNVYGDTITVVGTIYIEDVPRVEVTAGDSTIWCIIDSVITIYSSIESGYPPYSYLWNTGDTVPSFEVDAYVNGTYDYIIEVTDGCGFVSIDTATIIINETLSIDTVYSLPSGACNPTGDVFAEVSGYTGIPNIIWNGPGATNPNSIDATVWNDISSGWYFFNISDDVCEKIDSVFVDILDPPSVAIDPVTATGCAGMSVTFSLEVQNTVQYEWGFGNGSPVISTTSAASQSSSFQTSSVVTVTGYDAAGCPASASAFIEIVPCGCTDPAGLNYDENAVLDDGSCIYPEPIVIAPNVFSPNADILNDVFFLETQYTTSVHLTITNRWGNVLYDSEGPAPAWDGTINGDYAAEGVYFYRYEATGIMGDVIEGHGFFHLTR